MCLLVLLALPAAASWEQFHNNAAHTGYSDAEGPDANDLLWMVDTIPGGYTLIPSTSVAVAEGQVYANCDGTADCALVAFDQFTGDVVWTTSIDAREWDSWSSPSYHNGYVFTSTGQETVCVNATDGNVEWTFVNPTGEPSCNAGPAIADGKVICSDWEGLTYYCLNETTGAQLWTFVGTDKAQSTPAIDNNRIVLTFYDQITCLDIDGNTIWSIAVSPAAIFPGGAPTISGDTVYLTTYDFNSDDYTSLMALSMTDGSLLWDQPVMRTDSTPAVAYGNVYVCSGVAGTTPSKTYCFNATTGTPVWSTAEEFNGIGDWTCSPAVADGKIYVGQPNPYGQFGNDGLYALDALTGDVIWHDENAGGTPAISDGMIYSIGVDNSVTTLYAFKEDWNPWNNPASDSGQGITIGELIAAYNCYSGSNPAPQTGETVDIGKLIAVYNAYSSSSPMAVE